MVANSKLSENDVFTDDVAGDGKADQMRVRRFAFTTLITYISSGKGSHSPITSFENSPKAIAGAKLISNVMRSR